jgi:hypothetical protein
MTTGANGLGRYFDIVPAIVPVNLNTGANTGSRVHMKDCRAVSIVVFASTGTAGSDLQVDVQESNAATGGTIQDLDVVTKYYTKDASTLTSSSTWAEVSQAAASEVTDVGGAGTSAENQQIAVIEVRAEQLSDGFEWLSVNMPQPGATKLGCAFYIRHGLEVMRKPQNLANPNT